MDAAAIGSAKLVGEYVAVVRKLDDGWHPRPGCVVACVSDVVYGRAPGDQVGGCLMGELLSIPRVTLIGVVADQLIIVDAANMVSHCGLRT